MKKGMTIILTVSLGTSLLIAAAGSLKQLAELYKECRFFELRDAVQSSHDLSSETEFYRGAVDEAFNRLDSAIARLLSYLNGASADSPRPLAKEAWALLADAYRRSGRYGKSAEAQRTILERFSAGLDADEKASRENQTALWSALARVPPQAVEILGDSMIRMEDGDLPVRVKDQVLYFAYDTGANLSVLYQSAAAELGLAFYGPGIKIQSGTGKWIEGHTVVVPEMRLGQVIVRNAVFLVLPDGFFPARRVRPGVERRGLLGAPIIVALREVTETREGLLLIPAWPRPRRVRNMCFFGFMPVVEVVHRGARLSFCLDTGSTTTFLHLPFFRCYRGEIEARSKLRVSTLGGVGDARAVKIHILDELAFKSGGINIALKNIAVHTEVTHSSTAQFFGTLGLDLLTQCSRMTFNFESMSFVLE